MMHPNPNDLLEEILTRDPRYTAGAYAFVREGLAFAVRRLEKPRHISGQELLGVLREFAIDEFGPMAKTVLNDWGVERTEDFGEIVFNMVETGLLGKTEKDTRADFSGGYDFNEAFRTPFLPASASLKS